MDDDDDDSHYLFLISMLKQELSNDTTYIIHFFHSAYINYSSKYMLMRY